MDTPLRVVDVAPGFGEVSNGAMRSLLFAEGLEQYRLIACEVKHHSTLVKDVMTEGEATLRKLYGQVEATLRDLDRARLATFDRIIDAEFVGPDNIRRRSVTSLAYAIGKRAVEQWELISTDKERAELAGGLEAIRSEWASRAVPVIQFDEMRAEIESELQEAAAVLYETATNEKELQRIESSVPLSTRQNYILQVLRQENITSQDVRLTREQIAKLAEGKACNADGFKEPLAHLVKLGYLHSKKGSGGGYWLKT